MIVSSINFSLFLMCLKGKVGRLFKDEELHWFLASVGILTFLITLALVFQNHYDWELAFRKALFQVSTVHTSCGFATDDYNMWPPFTWLLLFIAMLSGGCTGSTSGGIKNIEHIRLQESDRIEAMVNELNNLGVDVKEGRDRIEISPANVKPGVVDTYNDHRMAMSFALIGLRVDGIIIDNYECCCKTFENYFEVLEKACAQ